MNNIKAISELVEKSLGIGTGAEGYPSTIRAIKNVADFKDSYIEISIPKSPSSSERVSMKVNFGELLQYLYDTIKQLAQQSVKEYLTKDEADGYYIPYSGTTTAKPITGSLVFSKNITGNIIDGAGIIHTTNKIEGGSFVTTGSTTTGTLTVKTDVNIGTDTTAGNLTVGTNDKLGSVTTYGNVEINDGKLTVHGDITSNDDSILTIGTVKANVLSADSEIKTTGSASVGTLTASTKIETTGSASVGALTATGVCQLGSSSSKITLNGAVEAKSTCDIIGATTMNGGGTIDGNMTVKGNILLNGNPSDNKGKIVAGDSPTSDPSISKSTTQTGYIKISKAQMDYAYVGDSSEADKSKYVLTVDGSLKCIQSNSSVDTNKTTVAGMFYASTICGQGIHAGTQTTSGIVYDSNAGIKYNVSKGQVFQQNGDAAQLTAQAAYWS